MSKKMKRPSPFRVTEGGSDGVGWVSFALFGIAAWGPNRQAAWDLFVGYVQEFSRARIADAAAASRVAS